MDKETNPEYDCPFVFCTFFDVENQKDREDYRDNPFPGIPLKTDSSSFEGDFLIGYEETSQIEKEGVMSTIKKFFMGE